MAKKGQGVLLANNLMGNKPISFLVGASELSDFFSKELDIAYRKDF